MLTLGLDFTTAGLIALNKALVLNTQVLNFIVTLLKLNFNLMAFFFCSLQLAN